MKNIVLTGLMGCGKSSVAKAIAQADERFEFIDIDHEIEKFQNMKISKIFEKYGERFFRELEFNFIKPFEFFLFCSLLFLPIGILFLFIKVPFFLFSLM